MVKQKKLWISGLCRNDVTATYCKDWNPRYPSNMSECLQFPWIPLRYPQTSPKHPPDISRELKISTDDNRRQQTTTDTSRHPQIPTGAVWVCLEVSVGACCGLLTSWVPWRCLEGVWEVSGGCLGTWKLEALRCVWGVSGIPVHTVWSRSIFLAQPWNPQLFSLDHSETSKYINVHI